jgi:hypothetical protein
MIIVARLTCTCAAHTATRGARGAFGFFNGTLTHSTGRVASARVAAGASLRCAVHIVGSAQVCRVQDNTISESAGADS